MTSYSVLPPGAIEKEDGTWIYPATQRPDGSWRKERRIRKVTNRRGKEIPFVPQEEQRKFEPSAVRRERLRREASASAKSRKETNSTPKISPKIQDHEERYGQASFAAGVSIRSATKQIDNSDHLDKKECRGKSEAEMISDTIRERERKDQLLKKKLQQIEELKLIDESSLNEDQKLKLDLEDSLTSELNNMLTALTQLTLKYS